MDTTQILLAFFGTAFGILLAIIGFFLKRTLSKVDSMIEVLPTLLTIKEFEGKCAKAQEICGKARMLEKAGDEKTDNAEERSFKEKWDNLIDRVKEIEKILFRHHKAGVE
jgi:hypothetical protein